MSLLNVIIAVILLDFAATVAARWFAGLARQPVDTEDWPT